MNTLKKAGLKIVARTADRLAHIGVEDVDGYNPLCFFWTYDPEVPACLKNWKEDKADKVK